MSRNSQRLADYLAHIVEAIERIVGCNNRQGITPYEFSKLFELPPLTPPPSPTPSKSSPA